MKNNKGFTLIEILIVVGIIGVLSSVVLGQLTLARQKAANATIKANMSSLRTEAGIAYEEAAPNSYDDVCASPKFMEALTQVGTLGGTPAECFDSDTAWVVKATLNLAEGTNTSWCADLSGKSKGITDVEYAAIIS